jgi:N-methylhydantoinase A/acetophenone carboxylase
MEFTGFTIDIDTGGTFTDGFMTSGDRVELVKVDTTPHDLTVCFLNCIEEGARRFGLGTEEFLARTSVIRYSTTVGTNSLLQRKGPKLGLVATEGFTDTLYVNPDKASEVLTDMVQPNMRVGIKGNIDGSGKIVQPLDEEEVRQAVEHLLDSGARSEDLKRTVAANSTEGFA